MSTLIKTCPICGRKTKSTAGNPLHKCSRCSCRERNLHICCICNKKDEFSLAYRGQVFCPKDLGRYKEEFNKLRAKYDIFLLTEELDAKIKARLGVKKRYIRITLP